MPRRKVDLPGLNAGERLRVAKAPRGERGHVIRTVVGAHGAIIARGIGDASTAQLFAEAPAMYEALLQVVTEDRECGYFDQHPHHPKVGCDCGGCQGLRALAVAEGGGRCILCGCTEFDACAGDFGEGGCAWVDNAQLVCSAHPAKMIAAAQAFVAQECRR
jgi:hypothetical protein